ncbi:MAG: hypothetical protein JJU37_00915 [Balneolaceae bacterium]|nr:hypothetical protein [Balneolaceae bacterium]
MANRIYSEEEVSRLIRRAVELEAERSISKEGNRTGLTIGDLEQIAAEAGIDPELIIQAATELNQSSTSVKKETAKIKREEIVCEQWLHVTPDNRILDDLITELNHRYGTSDTDISWWNRLWDDYDGKARTRKSASSYEWEYTDELGYFTTRVLMQKRSDRFRIRVSKRQLWDMNWSSEFGKSAFLAVSIVLFTVLGGVTAFSIFGTAWPGIATGSLAALLSYPVIRYFSARSLDKHREEVTETAYELAELTAQLMAEPAKKNTKSNSEKSKKSRLIDIEFLDETEESAEANSRLRNKLR